MKQYIGTKIIEAEPAWLIDGKIIPKHECVLLGDYSPESGYKVRYSNGNESWSPAEVFEEAYRPTDGMPFGLAIEAAKMGKCIARAGWNGKGQYVALVTRIECKRINGDGPRFIAFHDDIGSLALAFFGTRGVQVGWLASQSDMLAEDWMIVQPMI